jgi:hypothetical protein
MDKKTYSTPVIDRPKSPLPLLLWTLVVLAGGSALGWFAQNEYQRLQADNIVGALRNEIDSRDQQIEALKRDRQTTQQRVVALERSVQIDKSALQRLKEQIGANQEERLKLEEELSLMRSACSEDDNKEGLRIRSFRISRTTGEESYHYRFTVTQTLGENERMEGRILLHLQGTQGDTETTLSLSDISPEEEDSIKMGFKHFQDVEGIIKPPEGFKPSSLTIEIAPDNEEIEGLTKKYEWIVSD